MRLFLALALAPATAGCGRGDTLGTTPAVLAAESATTPPSPLTVFDLAGDTIDPFAPGSAKAIVFIFVGIECPISNRYAPEIRTLEEKFARNGVHFRLVYPDADNSAEAIAKHVKEYQLPGKVLRDTQHDLVRLANVRVTPEAAVFVPGRRLVYRGRIDNRYVALGKARVQATQHDLQDVLQAILRGNPVPHATAKAVGCHIPDLK